MKWILFICTHTFLRLLLLIFYILFNKCAYREVVLYEEEKIDILEGHAVGKFKFQDLLVHTKTAFPCDVTRARAFLENFPASFRQKLKSARNFFCCTWKLPKDGRGKGEFPRQRRGGKFLQKNSFLRWESH